MILNPNDSILLADTSLVGGKASNLATMKQMGVPIPEWIVVTTKGFQSFIEHNDLIEDYRNIVSQAKTKDRILLKQELNQFQKKIIAAELHEEFLESFRLASNGLKQFDQSYYAVRSSVVGEDSVQASFAGQMDSYLYQMGEVNILESIKKCFASAFNDRAILYRIERNISIENIEAAVIIQKMVNADVSGVLFSANPANGNLNQCMVSCTFGLGEGIVSGECQTDEFKVDHGTWNISKQINEKDSKLCLDTTNSKGLQKVELSQEEKNQQSIPDDKLKELCQMACRLANQYKHPQDIEWAFEADILYILQTRPITRLASPSEQHGNTVVFDNSNIQESYCGVTTPLTFSFARNAYATVYEQTMRAMGIKDRIIIEHQDMLDNMLGLIKGRIYYNINNWYKGLLLLPSFKTNKEDMERMMGLQDPVDFVEDTKLSLWPKIKKYPAMITNLLKLFFAFSRLKVRVNSFLCLFKKVYDSIDRNTLHKKSFSELIELAMYLEKELLLKWETPIINDFYVMMMNGKMHRWLTKLKIENPALHQNNLLSGEEGIESTEPTKVLLRLTNEVRNDKTLLELFEKVANPELLGAIQYQSPAFYQKCMEYIELYGDRCMGELKLETETLRTKPGFIFAVIKNYLKQGHLTEDNLHAKEMKLRKESEQLIYGMIGKRLGIDKIGRFKRDLNKLRSAVKNRENMRLARTRLFGLFRDIYYAIGNQMSLYGILSEPRDIFYLKVDEIKDLYTGTSVQKDLKPLVKARKAEFTQYEKEDLAHHFSTNGLVYYQNQYRYEEDFSVDDNHDKLTGTGCYPGIVEGEIKLIFSPDDELDLNGQILCTVRTDPGWAPLFPTAGGILVERGSTLSHSAVVARELGIPAIVGIKGLTQILKANELVKMDGANGTIERLENE